MDDTCARGHPAPCRASGALVVERERHGDEGRRSSTTHWLVVTLVGAAAAAAAAACVWLVGMVALLFCFILRSFSFRPLCRAEGGTSAVVRDDRLCLESANRPLKGMDGAM